MSDQTTLDLEAHELRASAPRGDGAYLVVREGQATQVIDLADGDDVILGRASEATIHVDDAKASREHARFSRRGRLITVEDLGSRNGTLVGDELVRSARVAIRSGDLIRVGAVEIRVGETAPPRDAGQSRVGAELERLVAEGGQGLLLRLSMEPDTVAATLAAISTLLGPNALFEPDGDGPGESVCLLPGRTDPERLLAELRRVAPGLLVGVARFPADGTTFAALMTKSERRGGRSLRLPALPDGVIVAEPAMGQIFALVRKVAPTPTTVLILGETGVGKEVIAEQIHAQSACAKGPFIRINCGALPATLIESELFGHERGAFTGAERRKIGYLEAAHGGTLFLDEIGELPLPMQAKLLRAIETRRVQRVGSTEEIPVDVRLIAATHHDLQEDVRRGVFRGDLFFRLSAFILEVPPLRARPSEIALFAELFARQLSARIGAPSPVIAPDAMAVLRSYSWPGNVRELRNALEYAVVLVEEDGELRAEHLPASLRRGEATASPVPVGAMKEQLASIEQQSIEAALEAEGGNQTRAAKRLGISRRALLYKIEKYGLRRGQA